MGRVGRTGLRPIAVTIVVSVALTLGSCHDYDFYNAIRGLSAYIGALDTIGHVSAVSGVERSMGVDPYIYTLSIGEKPISPDGLDDAVEMADDRIYAVDISDGASPAVVGSVAAPPGGSWYTSWQRDIAVDNHHQLIVVGEAFTIFDLADPAAPLFLGDYPFPAGASLIGLRGVNYAVVERAAGQIIDVIDYLDPANPSLHGSVDLGAQHRAFAATSELLAVGYANGVKLYELSDLATPASTLLSTFSTSSQVTSLRFLNDDRLAVATTSATVTFVDTSNPSLPDEISRLEIADSYRSYALFDTLFVGSERHLWRVNVDDYAKPELRFAYTLPAGGDLGRVFMDRGVAFWEMVYVAAGDLGLITYQTMY